MSERSEAKMMPVDRWRREYKKYFESDNDANANHSCLGDHNDGYLGCALRIDSPSRSALVWDLETQSREIHIRPRPAAVQERATSKIEPWENGVKITYDMVGQRGETAHREWSGKFDGRDYAVEGTDYVLTNAYSQIADHAYEAVVKVDDEIVSTATIVISPMAKP